MRVVSVVVLLVVFGESALASMHFSTQVSLETSLYHGESEYGVDDQFDHRLRIRPDFSYAWDNFRKVVQFIPYGVLSTVDGEEWRGDIREASFTGSYGDFEVKAGISRVFWGVAESVHLVDVINQTDLVEDVDGEEKLGQPMFSLSWISSYGQFGFYLLPYFRERTFPGDDGRLHSPIAVDDNDPIYESGREERHLDWAVRWTKSVAAVDLGFSHFYGTSRDPILISSINERGDPIWVPAYNLIHQTGLDLQVTLDSLLLKHESIYRNYLSYDGDFQAQVSGFEYTFYTILDSSADLGVLAEYIYASKDDNSLIGRGNDLFLGFRCTLNDLQGTEILIGIIDDLQSSDYTISVEGKRRITDNITLSVEAWFFNFENNAMTSFDRASYAKVELSYVW